MTDVDFAERLARLENNSIAPTFADRPAPPLSDFARAKMAADEKKRQQRIAEEERREKLARNERDRIAEEQRLRTERNAPRVAELLAELEPLIVEETELRARIRPIEAELRTLR